MRTLERQRRATELAHETLAACSAQRVVEHNRAAARLRVHEILQLAGAPLHRALPRLVRRGGRGAEAEKRRSEARALEVGKVRFDEVAEVIVGEELVSR